MLRIIIKQLSRNTFEGILLAPHTHLGFCQSLMLDLTKLNLFSPNIKTTAPLWGAGGLLAANILERLLSSEKNLNTNDAPM